MTTQSIGNRIQYLRLYGDVENLDMSQRDMQAVTGVSRAAISYMETGKFEPSVRHIKTIASHFNVSTDWLILGKESVDTSKSKILKNAALEFSDQKQEIIEKLLLLSEDRVGTLNQVLTSLLSLK